MVKRRSGKLNRRFAGGISVLLCIAMLLSLFPFAVAADDPVPSGTEKKSDGKDVSKQNLYALVTSTGAAAGDSVVYFGVRYTGTDGIQRSEFVFPNNGSLAESYATFGEVYSPTALTDYYTMKFGYSPSEPIGSNTGLAQNSADTYLVTTCTPIKTVHSIDMFMRHGGEGVTRCEWTCNDIRLYKVNTIFGLEMAGYYSTSYFASFSGELIAKFLGEQWNSGDFAINKSDKQFRIGSDKNAVYDLQTKFTDGKIDTKYNASATAKNLTFRFDFSDKYGAGIESLANLYKDKKARLTDMGLVEALNVIITYDDIYGASRKVTLPVILSSVGWALNSNPDLASASVIGIGQQGDTLLFEGVLPDYAKMTGYSLFFGANAAKKAGLSDCSFERAAERLTSLKDDEIYYAGLSIFDAETAKAYATTEDAVLTMTTQGNPLYYYKSVNSSGQKMSNNQQKSVFGDMKVPPPAESGAVTLLSTETGTVRYIFEITTDEPVTASTTDDLIARISYVSTDGNTRRTDRILLRDAAKDFLGFWPAKNDADIAYLSGVTSAGKLYFALDGIDVDYFSALELQLVNKEKATQIMKGEPDEDVKTVGKVDDWQLAGFKIYKVTQLSRRRAVWMDIDTNTYTTDRMITREFDTTRVFQTYDKKLLLTESSPAKVLTLSETGDPGFEDADVEWETIKSSMTYSETMQELGFDKARFTYTVNVTVQSNSATDDDLGDCGSVNKFYFQLIFENGVSAYVQANQQLTGDGFRAGHTESFRINTNRNYGDLKAVRIIPDDTVDEDNIYDKLNVKEINVIQNSDSGVACTWNFYPVGWIGIDYQDTGAQSTISGQKMRSEFELSRNYLVSSKGYSLNLLFAMTTGVYAGENPQYAGSISAVIYYRDNNNIICDAPVDVAQAMAEYAEQEALLAPDNNPGIAGKRIIDRSYMLRENHVDRFIVSLTNVRELLYMELQIGGMVNTTWQLEDVTVYMIDEDGPLIVNSCDEYQRDAKLTCICSSTSENGYEILTNYAPETNTSVIEEYKVVFSDFTINVELDDFETKIERTPTGDDDACNIILYPKSGTNLKELNKVSVALKYQSREYDKPFQVSLKSMHISEELGTVYYRGLSTKSMTKLNELIVTSDRDVYFDHAIVQQVRSDVIIRTYYVPLDPALNAHMDAISGAPYRSAELEEKQVLSMQFSEDTAEKALVENLNDIAVCFSYSTTTDFDSVVYNSAYVFLTDQQIRKAAAGERVDLTFHETCVNHVKSITLVATDVIDATVNCATVTTYHANADGKAEKTNCYTFSEAVKLTRNKQSVPADDNTHSNVADLTMTIRFDSEKMTQQMLDDRISLTVGYVDYMGDTGIFTIDDIDKFRTSPVETKKESITLNVLVPDLMSLKFAKLEPHSTLAGVSAGIPVTTVDAHWELSGVADSVPQREVSKMVEEGVGYSINLAHLDVLCDISDMAADGSVKFSRSICSRDYDMTLTGADCLRLTPRVTNSAAGFDIQVETVSGNCTYDLTKKGEDYFFTPKKPAPAEDPTVSEDSSDTPDENGDEDAGDVSDPETPSTGKITPEDTVYRIVISSKEIPSVKVTVNLTYTVG